MICDCQKIRDEIDDYLDGEMTRGRMAVFSAHIRDCTPCRVALRQAEEVMDQLHSLPEPTPPSDLRQRQFSRLWQDNEQLLDSGTRRPFRMLAMAATLVIGLILGALFSHWLTLRQPLPLEVVTLQSDEVRRVTFAIHSARDMEQVNVSLDIPDNVEIVGHEGERTISWQTGLKQGQNLLHLPVRFSDAGDGLLTMRLNRPGKATKSKSLHIRALVSETRPI